MMKHSFPHAERVFAPTPRAITQQVDDKFSLYRNYRNNMAANAFPPTFSSIRQALLSTEQYRNQDMLFFLKESDGTRGQGIRVLCRSELEKEPEPHPGTVVIQTAITNLLTVDSVDTNDDEGSTTALHGRRFDIRFYVLVCGGTAYLHSNMFAKWEDTPKPYDPHDASIENNVPKLFQYTPELEHTQGFIRDFLFFPKTSHTWNKNESFSSSEWATPGNFDPAAWREAVSIALDKAKPSLTPLLKESMSDPMSYHLLGGDAILQQSGDAVIIEFNAFPDLRWFSEKRTDCLERRMCTRRLVLPDASKPNGYTVTPPTPLFYPTVTGYTAQMLRDMVALVMGLEEPENLHRFREIGTKNQPS